VESIRQEFTRIMSTPNQITGANAGERLGFAAKSRVALSHRPGVAQFFRSAALVA
jgi:hypothetical protein